MLSNLICYPHEIKSLLLLLLNGVCVGVLRDITISLDGNTFRGSNSVMFIFASLFKRRVHLKETNAPLEAHSFL